MDMSSPCACVLKPRSVWKSDIKIGRYGLSRCTFTTESHKDLFLFKGVLKNREILVCHNNGKKCSESETQVQSWGKAFTVGRNFVFATDLWRQNQRLIRKKCNRVTVFSVECWCLPKSSLCEDFLMYTYAPEQKRSSLTAAQVKSVYCFVKDMLETWVRWP